MNVPLSLLVALTRSHLGFLPFCWRELLHCLAWSLPTCRAAVMGVAALFTTDGLCVVNRADIFQGS